MPRVIVLCACCILLANCKKKTSVCEEWPATTAFTTREIVGDTSFYSDTVYNDNYISFEPSIPFQSVAWKIGNDPRSFDSSPLILHFGGETTTLTVELTLIPRAESRLCLSPSGTYIATRALTLVEQFDKPTLTISPLKGNYRGRFLDQSSDEFIIRIDYFDSLKYDVSVTGTKNFYWISNIPNHYIDSTSDPAIRYPELRYGHRLEMGYKSMAFGTSGSNCIQGAGWLNRSNDSIYIAYGNAVCGRKIFAGKRL